MNALLAAVLEVPRRSVPRVEPVPPTPARTRPRPLPTWIVLTALFAVAAAYHAVASLGHVSPAVFTDELLHSKLAQSLAAGHGLLVRGEPFFFPSPLPALAQAPAWLAGGVPVSYELAKILNALVMSAAVFPAYWLARALVRPRYALLAATAAVASPAMVYHSYLLSEALAYPVFFLAVAVIVRALQTPSTRWGAGVLAVSLLAVATRTQFLALPLAFCLAALAGGRTGLRRQALPLGGLLAVGAAGLAVGGGALGPYVSATTLNYELLDALRWGGATAALLPFAAGWLVAPGAALGLAYLLVRPRLRADRSVAVFIAALGAIVLLQVGVVAAADSHRPLERYAIYLAPLAVLLFFAYVERGAPGRRLYAGLALSIGLLAWLMPFPALADFRFSFDSPTLSSFGMLSAWIGNANAATVFAAVPLAGSVLVALVPLRRRVPALFAAGAAGLLLVSGLATYAGDHSMTRRAAAAWSASEPDWVDQGGLGRADYLALPGGSPHFGWMLEAWNRDVDRTIRLGVKDTPTDPFAASRAMVAPDGVLLVDGRPATAGLLVVNDFGTQIDLEGTVVARPRRGLTELRVPAAPHVRWIATGLYSDGWSSGNLSYRVWPERVGTAGVYEVGLALPSGYPARTVTLTVEGVGRRTLRLKPGSSVHFELPAPLRAGLIPALHLSADGGRLVGTETANAYLVSLRVTSLAYRPRGPAAVLPPATVPGDDLLAPSVT
jgi:Dolichyl-phosphate-mannose-protein mannosyltransferase